MNEPEAITPGLVLLVEELVYYDTSLGILQTIA